MPKLKHYINRSFYRIDSLAESLIVVVFYKFFVKKPSLQTYRALLYKRPVTATLFFNNFGVLFIYLKSIFFKVFFKRDIVLTTDDQFLEKKRGNDNSIWPTQPFLLKKKVYNFSDDNSFQEKILSSYSLAIQKDNLNFKKGDWWEKNSEYVKELFLKDEKLNPLNIEKFLSLNYSFDLFKDSSPLNNLEGFKKLNTIFKLILDYHRFASYMDINVLQNISESTVGNIKAPVYRNQILSSRILTLGYVVSQIKNYTNFNYETEFRFMDIGGGFGNLSRLMLSFFNKSKCVLIDLPEVCIASSYYLKANFPKKKIVLFSDAFDAETFNIDLINNADVLIIPSWSIKYLPANFIDLSINTASLGEMTKEYGNYYIKEMSRVTKKYFYSSNRTDSKNSIWDGFGHYEYVLDQKWMPILYKQSPTWHLEYLGKKII